MPRFSVIQSDRSMVGLSPEEVQARLHEGCLELVRELEQLDAYRALFGPLPTED